MLFVIIYYRDDSYIMSTQDWYTGFDYCCEPQTGETLTKNREREMRLDLHVSQCVPRNPIGQVQVYIANSLLQVAPFKHGLLAHSSISETQNGTTYDKSYSHMCKQKPLFYMSVCIIISHLNNGHMMYLF